MTGYELFAEPDQVSPLAGEDCGARPLPNGDLGLFRRYINPCTTPRTLAGERLPRGVRCTPWSYPLR